MLALRVRTCMATGRIFKMPHLSGKFRTEMPGEGSSPRVPPVISESLPSVSARFRSGAEHTPPVRGRAGQGVQIGARNLDVSLGTVPATQRQPLATLRHESIRQPRFVFRVVYGEQRRLVDLAHRVCDCTVHATVLSLIRLEHVIGADAFGRRSDAGVELNRARRGRNVEIRKFHDLAGRLGAAVSGGNRTEACAESAEDRTGKQATQAGGSGESVHGLLLDCR